MISIALQSPWPAATHRAEKPTPSAHALPPVAAVPSVPDNATQGMMADQSSQRDRARETFRFQPSRDQPGTPRDTAPQPFPDLRFADPLPDLPELDLPGKATAWQSALGVLRRDGQP